MSRWIKAALVLPLFLLTAQSCTVDPGGGPGVVGPIVGPGVGRIGACFVNARPQTAFYRVEWRDGSGRVRVFRMFPNTRRRIIIGAAPAQWCWSYNPASVTRLRCQRPLRVRKNC